MIESFDDTREFFQERVDMAISRLEVPASDEARLYLRELLCKGAGGGLLASAGTPVVQRLAAALDEDDFRARREGLRDTGDSALYTCGFFQEHLHRKGLSVDYYVTMGQRAYATAGVMPGPHRCVMGELASRFEGFWRVLDEVRETTTLRTPQDIVRLYDRWRRTQSPKLAERLQQEGVLPGQRVFDGRDSATVEQASENHRLAHPGDRFKWRN